MLKHHRPFIIFFFNDTATTEIYTLSLHDALPISFAPGLGQAENLLGDAAGKQVAQMRAAIIGADQGTVADDHGERDRKSTRLNSSHSQISYAVFCLKKKRS